MSSADFRRIKSVHCSFWRVVQYIVKIRKKREILFNFWLAEKNTKTHEIDFSTRKRKREKKAKIGETASQNNNE